MSDCRTMPLIYQNRLARRPGSAHEPFFLAAADLWYISKTCPHSVAGVLDGFDLPDQDVETRVRFSRDPPCDPVWRHDLGIRIQPRLGDLQRGRFRRPRGREHAAGPPGEGDRGDPEQDALPLRREHDHRGPELPG